MLDDLLFSSASEPLRVLAAWLFTYAIHSTLVLTLVWSLDRLFASDRARESAWKSALVASLLSSTLQVGLGVHPFRLALVFPASEEAGPATPVGPSAMLDDGLGTEAADSVAGSPSLPKLPSVLWLWGLGSAAALSTYVVRRWRLG